VAILQEEMQTLAASGVSLDSAVGQALSARIGSTDGGA